MLVASLGSAVASDLGLSSVWGDEPPGPLCCGPLEPLVAMLQETPLAKLQPLLVEKLGAGLDLRTLVTAAALANARTFGGQDYTGYHTFMALVPALHMADELPENRRALPVLKVVYRNTQRIQEQGGRSHEVLREIRNPGKVEDASGGELLRDATRRADFDAAEATFAALAQGPVGEAYNHLQFCVQDEVDVHRVVLAWRAYALLEVTGEQYAHQFLRQSVRYCVDAEKYRLDRARPEPEIRTVLPKLLDQHRLLSRPLGERQVDDGWVEGLARTILAGTRPQAAEAAAAALAEGISPDAVAEAISVAANLLVLHDPGRPESVSPLKPQGSVHGDSVGVHASDAANAWRNIARVSKHRNTVASLIVGAFHTAGQSGRVTTEPFPYAEHLAGLATSDPAELLRETEAAIRAKDQAHACALVHRYGETGQAARPLFDLLLRFGISEDGALHAEKYYRTVSEEFATLRPAFRWRQLVALARVTASEYGFPAPGHQEACQLLRV
jgi:hypothetical protein